MRAVIGWVSVISVGQVCGPLSLIAIATHAIQRRRFSPPMIAATALAVFSLWPALWGFGFATIPFPASLASTKPVATVRPPLDGPVRVAWGGDRVAVNQHSATPDQRWAYDLLAEPR